MNLQSIPTKPMSMTEVLNHVRTHLLTQNAKCQYFPYGHDYSCRYRYGDKSCAIGCLIPNSEYNSEWEGTRVEELLFGICQSSIDESFLKLMDQVVDLKNSNIKRLLRALQYIHDVCDVNLWPTMLDSLNGCETWDCDVWTDWFTFWNIRQSGAHVRMI